MFSKKQQATPKKSHRKQISSGQFYFVPRDPGVTQSVRDKGDDGEVLEIADHQHDETYEPKPVNRTLSLVCYRFYCVSLCSVLFCDLHKYIDVIRFSTLTLFYSVLGERRTINW